MKLARWTARTGLPDCGPVCARFCITGLPRPENCTDGPHKSQMTGHSEVETSPAHATGPEAGIWEVQWTDSRRLALDGKQLRSSLP
jgi:hypothetical protein